MAASLKSKPDRDTHFLLVFLKKNRILACACFTQIINKFFLYLSRWIVVTILLINSVHIAVWKSIKFYWKEFVCSEKIDIFTAHKIKNGCSSLKWSCIYIHAIMVTIHRRGRTDFSKILQLNNKSFFVLLDAIASQDSVSSVSQSLSQSLSHNC